MVALVLSVPLANRAADRARTGAADWAAITSYTTVEPLTSRGATDQDVSSAAATIVASHPELSAVRVWSPAHALVASSDGADTPGSNQAMNDGDLDQALAKGSFWLVTDRTIAGGEGPATFEAYTAIKSGGGDSVVSEFAWSDATLLSSVHSFWMWFRIAAALGTLLAFAFALASMREPVARIGAGVPFYPENVPPGLRVVDAEQAVALEQAGGRAKDRVAGLQQRLDESERLRKKAEGELQQALTALGTGGKMAAPVGISEPAPVPAPRPTPEAAAAAMAAAEEKKRVRAAQAAEKQRAKAAAAEEQERAAEAALAKQAADAEAAERRAAAKRAAAEQKQREAEAARAKQVADAEAAERQAAAERAAAAEAAAKRAAEKEAAARRTAAKRAAAKPAPKAPAAPPAVPAASVPAPAPRPDVPAAAASATPDVTVRSDDVVVSAQGGRHARKDEWPEVVVIPEQQPANVVAAGGPDSDREVLDVLHRLVPDHDVDPEPADDTSELRSRLARTAALKKPGSRERQEHRDET